MAKNRFLGFGSVIVAIAAGLLSHALADEGLQTIRGGGQGVRGRVPDRSLPAPQGDAHGPRS